MRVKYLLFVHSPSDIVSVIHASRETISLFYFLKSEYQHFQFPPQKNLLNSFCKRTFVSKYHLYYISTDMENTTHKEETYKTPFARIRQRLKERKRRVMRLIELKRLRRIRKKLYPGTPIARIAVPSWRECIAIVADNMPSISTSLSGNTSDNTLKMSISLIAKSGKPCG